MNYEEKLPVKWKSIVLLVFAFLAIYCPLQLGDWDLRRREDQYAAIVAEMNIMQPNTIAHGEQIPFSSPMFPWLTALLYQTGLSLELCLRLISVASVAVLSILAWEAGRRANDLQTAVVSAAMMFSSIIVIEKAMDGYPNFTGLLFLFSAWLSWFTFGVARGKWNMAWVISFFFCSMAFYTIGWMAILLFIFPLIFMRRPMTVWPKLRKPGFFLGLTLLIFFMLIWILPRWLLKGQTPFHSISVDFGDPGDYFEHILFFPFAIFFRYLPWSLITWPAFCVAFFPIDKNPIFSRFLRTIVISLFFFFWFSPFTEAMDIIYIAPPLSILCGINYWLLVRRHGHQLHAIFSYFLYMAIALSTGIIIFYVLPDSFLSEIPYLEGKIDFRHSTNTATGLTQSTIGLTQSAIALIVALIAVRFPKKDLPVYSHILAICISVSLCFWAIHIPYRTRHTENRDLGTMFAADIKKDLNLRKNLYLFKDIIVYKGPGIDGLYAPCIYMGVHIKKIYKLSELPENIDTVYMISTEYPVSIKRKWDYVTPKGAPHIYSRDKFYILKGTRIKKKDERAERK